MNPVVAQLTLRQISGGRRIWLLAALSVVALGLAGLGRALTGSDGSVDTATGVSIVDGFAIGVLVPLLGLILGTGAIASEIDDGSIVYLLAKPLPRQSIATTKTVVAATVGILTVGPTTWAAAMIAGLGTAAAASYWLAAVAGVICYSALFLLLSVLTRNAVVIGLFYALLWEGVVGGYVPGAQVLSVRQWATAVAEGTLGDRAADLGVSAAVSPVTGAVLLVVVTVACTVLAGRRLRTLRVTGDG